MRLFLLLSHCITRIINNKGVMKVTYNQMVMVIKRKGQPKGDWASQGGGS